MILTDTATRESNELRCARELGLFARGRVEAFCGTVHPDGTYKDRIYRSARSTGLQIAGDYGRRFLLELIQNAHDAHPPEETEGAIKILFDPSEGYTGVLYVANRGRGFTWSNVDALCSIGLSDKPVGESIGNKGLGFRSVIHVSDSPEVYSCLGSCPSDGRFDGYCFRFARSEDLERFIPDPTVRRLAEQDLPPFHVPVPLTDVPVHAGQLASEGFCTVIRLPLRNDVARQVVVDEIAVFRDQGAPLLLFLKRVTLLDVTVEGELLASYRFCQQCTPLTPGGSPEKDTISVVETGDHARYLVASSIVNEATVQKAIALSIEQSRLSPSWADWRGDGEVAVAVRLDGPVTPRIYTYLPLGEEAQPPFHGYLHAAFFPNVDRTSIEPNVPLNRLYVYEAAALCARTALALRRVADAGALEAAEAGRAILDLVCWRGNLGIEGEHGRRAATLIGDSFDAIGTPIQQVEAALIEPVPSGTRWATLGAARRWNHPELFALGADALVARAKLPLLARELETEHVVRFGTFAKELNRGPRLELTPAELVEAIERVAIAYSREKVAADTWKQFYRELNSIVAKHNLDLRGRRLLLCGDGELRLTQVDAPEPGFPADMPDPETTTSPATARKMRRRRTRIDVAVFVPSERAAGQAARAGASVSIPPELEQAFAYLRDDLDWYGELNHVRTYLEGAKLVRSYNAEELLIQVSALVRVDDRLGVRRAALTWAFRLYQEARGSRPISLRRARLYVPTAANKWVEARLAHFGAGWPAETHGDTLDRFLAAASVHSEDLERLRARLIGRPVSKPFSMRQVHDWTAFLTAIGVQRGLQPTRCEPRNLRVSGWDLSAARLAPRLALGHETTSVWAAAIAESGVTPTYRSSTYQHEGGIWVLPGQEEHAQLSAEARTLYASLILAWLESGEESVLNVQFYNAQFHRASRFIWPTPLAAFLRHGEWLPTQWVKGGQTVVKFERPTGVWLGDGGPYSLPHFLPGFPRALAASLERRSVVERMDLWCGANVFNDPKSMGQQVGFLADLYADNHVDAYYQRAFLNAYHDSWRRLARDQPAFHWATRGRPRYLIARRAGSYEAIGTEPEQRGNESLPKLYIRDTESLLQLALVEAMGACVFDVGTPVPDALRPLAERLLGARCLPISGVAVSLVLDGVDFEPERSDDEYGVAACPWLLVLVALAMESLVGAAAYRLPTDRRVVLDRLQRIHIRMAQTINFCVQGMPLGVPDDLQGAMALAADSRPTIVLRTAAGELDWDALIRGTRAIAELLGSADLAPHLQIGMDTLKQLGEQVNGPMPADKRLGELCEALHVRSSEAQAALAALGTDVRRLVRYLAPVVHYFGESPAVDRFLAAASDVQSVGEASALLQTVLGEPERLIALILDSTRRADGFAELRDALQLHFGRFNQSLIAVGEQADVYPELHAELLRAFIADKRDDIMDALRAPVVDAFQRRESLASYVQARGELPALRPDPAWLTTWREPDEALLRAWVDEWLRARGARALAAARTDLPSWSQARRENAVLLHKLVAASAPLVKAWCRKSQTAVPVAWQVPASPADAVAETLDAAGVLDFVFLDESELLGRMASLGLWPSGMPLTRSQEALALTEDDLNFERDKERNERLDRDKAARSIEFNGRTIDPHEVDHTELSTEIAANLTHELKSLGLANTSPVQRPPERSGKGGSVGNSGSGRTKRIHPDKTELIGFLGECAVYHWLKTRFPRQDIDSAWVSKNRSRLLLGDGRDDLGYDFVVRLRNQPWLLEVKAHLDDPLMFELGETELKAAHDAALRRSGEYRVIYLSNLRDISRMRIEILPNPLSADGETRFERGEQGVRYAFRRA